MKRRVYDNGLVAIAEPMTHKRKTNLIVDINVGSKNETAEKKGGAHLLEHMMFKSNDHQTTEEIAETSDFNGINRNASTSQVSTKLKFGFPPEKLSLSLKLAYQAINNISYKEEEFTKEKEGPVTDELIKYDRDPKSRFMLRTVTPNLWRGCSPLEETAIGTMESVRSLKLSDLYNLKDKFYVPNNMIIVCTGNLNEDEFFYEVEKGFGNLKPKSFTQPDLNWKIDPRIVYSEIPEFKDSKKEKDQSVLYMVHQINSRSHEDWQILDFIDTCIGEGFTSSLFQELREKRGIGYSQFSTIQSVQGNGILYMGVSGLKPHKVEEATKIMRSIIKNLKESELSDRFFEGKKTQFISDYLDDADSFSFRARYLLKNEYERYYQDFDTIQDRIERMQKEDVIDVAKRNLSEEPLIFLANPTGYGNPLLAIHH